MDRYIFEAGVAEDNESPDGTTSSLMAIDLGTEISRSGDRLSFDAFGRWPGSDTPAAGACIVRFAAAEADVSSDDLVGPGRACAVRYPRLGGVLFDRVVPGSFEAQLLRSAVERTIRAGYRTALAVPHVAEVPVFHDDADELWEAFLPHRHRVPRRLAATIWEVCRFDDFWTGVLEELGMEGDAVRFGHGHVSALSRSIRGLSIVGVALAVTERGGRHDRLQTGRRRGGRADRSAGGDGSRAPRSRRR